MRQEAGDMAGCRRSGESGVDDLKRWQRVKTDVRFSLGKRSLARLIWSATGRRLGSETFIFNVRKANKLNILNIFYSLNGINCAVLGERKL